MNKVVKGAKHQTRPSASYYYNTMGVPVGYQVTYRPRKGGKYILHSLQVGQNGTPYWRAEEKLPTLKRSKRRSSRKRSSRKRRSTRRRRNTRRKRSSRKRSSTRGHRRGKRTRRRSNKKGCMDPPGAPKSIKHKSRSPRALTDLSGLSAERQKKMDAMAPKKSISKGKKDVSKGKRASKGKGSKGVGQGTETWDGWQQSDEGTRARERDEATLGK